MERCEIKIIKININPVVLKRGRTSGQLAHSIKNNK